MKVTGDKPGVLCAGRLYCDLVFSDLADMPALGTETFAGSLGLHAGGGAFITAAYLSALGRPAYLAAILPSEPFREPVLADVSAFGVNVSLSRPAPPGTDPQVTAVVSTGEDRAFLTRADGPAIPRLTVDMLHGLGIGHLHIGELRTLDENTWLLELARAAGLTVSLDCGWDNRLGPEVASLIASVDLFLPNADEARLLRALGLPELCCDLTVVKNGVKGAVALTAEARIQREAQPARVVDTTGAGDAFNGGFLDRWLSDAPLPDCLAAGNVCGAAAVQAIGGTGGAELAGAELRAAVLNTAT